MVNESKMASMAVAGRKCLQVTPSVGLSLLRRETVFQMLQPKSITGGVNAFQRRWYRGSNRDIRLRKRRQYLEELVRKQESGELPVFDRRNFIIDNFDKELFAFQKRLKIEFENKGLLYAALVHPSVFQKKDGQHISEHLQKVISAVGTKVSWGKLAMLGFTLTSQILTESFYNSYPLMTSELLLKYVDSLMNRDVICNLANNLGITELILTEPKLDEINQEKHLPYSMEDVICDVFYALMGALHLDTAAKSPNVVKSFIEDFVLILSETEDFKSSFKIENPRKLLHDITSLANLEFTPTARLLFSSGKGTDFPLYVVGVYVADKMLGEGASYSLDTAIANAYENGVFRILQRKYPPEML